MPQWSWNSESGLLTWQMNRQTDKLLTWQLDRRQLDKPSPWSIRWMNERRVTHISQLRIHIMSHLVPKIIASEKWCLIFLFPLLNPIMIFFLHWGQKEMLLPGLYKVTCCSKEQANRIPKQKKLTRGTREFPAPPGVCMQMTPRSGTQTLNLLAVTFLTVIITALHWIRLGV